MKSKITLRKSDFSHLDDKNYPILGILKKDKESKEYMRLAMANVVKGQEQRAKELYNEFITATNTGRLPLLK